MDKCWFYENCNHKDCEQSFCVKKYKLDILYKNSLLSESQRSKVALRIDADGTDYEEFSTLANFENNIVDFVNKGNNLFLYSANCGNGKTSWAVRMIQAYFNNIWPKADLNCRALFISVPRFLSALKDNISNKSAYIEFIKANIMEADLIVWDDIATKVGTEFEINQLLSFIDGRIALGKANIYTSNLDKKQITEALGERLASRVCNLSFSVGLKGADKRGITVGGNR